VYVNRATYILSFLLVVCTFGFALLRSSGVVLFVSEAAFAQEVVTEFDWQVLGAEVFSESCAGCHAELTYIPQIVSAEGGRDYLAYFMVYGVQGQLSIAGRDTTNRHRSYAETSNEDLAAVMNHMLIAWGNDANLPEGLEFYTPAELEVIKADETTGEEVVMMRPEGL
jgi:hypothetical protein